MTAARKGSGPRVDRLERLACARPCAGCGRLRSPAGVRAQALEWSRLGPDARHELAGLLRVAAVPACVRCGRTRFDVHRLADAQKRRVLHLLRVVLRPDEPDSGSEEDERATRAELGAPVGKGPS